MVYYRLLCLHLKREDSAFSVPEILVLYVVRTLLVCRHVMLREVVVEKRKKGDQVCAMN